MCISKKLCPVPFDQQPLNEYSSLKTSWFFAWSTLSLSRYLTQIINIFSTLFLLLLPMVISIMPNNTNIMEISLFNIFMVNLIFIFIFIRLYLGWSYVTKRLVSATVFYEESGWYDGQIWIKNVETLTKDRLIGLYEVTPLIHRIKYSFIISFTTLLIEGLIYSFF